MALRAKFWLNESQIYCATRQDLARGFGLQLGGETRFKFKACSAMRCSFDLQLALVVKYASARLVWFFIHASDEILQLAFVS